MCDIAPHRRTILTPTDAADGYPFMSHLTGSLGPSLVAAVGLACRESLRGARGRERAGWAQDGGGRFITLMSPGVHQGPGAVMAPAFNTPRSATAADGHHTKSSACLWLMSHGTRDLAARM